MADIKDLKITDLLDISMLERLLRVFCITTNLSARIIDSEGNVIISNEPNNPFCTKHIRCSELGNKMCRYCARYAAEESRRNAEPSVSFCHTGLLQIAAPILIQDHIIGIFSSGHVVLKRPDRKTIAQTAKMLGLDEEALWETSRELVVLDKDRIEQAADELYTIAEALSEMAEGKWASMEAQEKLRRADSVKTDFLANMSHEIRTPMNAVIGMSEMALRENLSPVARDYINQIKNSGKALLTIINDILDYSKIESGKMEISEVEYEPMSVINDVASIIMTRIADKDVELLLDMDPALPRMLFGDNLRIRQILINLANNAVKFTNKGYVCINVRFDRRGDNEIVLNVAVMDTGIGIRKEDFDRLFNSFQQVDSKRNRNVEGTGLGLAICKQLLNLMGGTIKVESEYGKGSVFSFELPQKVVDYAPSVKLDNPDKYVIAGAFLNRDVADDFRNDASKLGVHTEIFEKTDHPCEAVIHWMERYEGKERFLIIEQAAFRPEIAEKLDREITSRIHTVLLVDAFADVRQWSEYSFLQIMKKPLSVLNLAALLNQQEYHFGELSAKEEEISFEAPDARVLIIDDNAINLTVAEGLLEPLHMQVDTALSGREALQKISEIHYDILFMDHMMPEMDGIETTRIIRRLYPEYAEVPIIALTANAISGTKEMFLAEGMNDFVAKPIEIRVLMSKVKQWLPVEKIKRMNSKDTESEQRQSDSDMPSLATLQIGDLKVQMARQLLGTDRLFWSVLKEYYRVIEKKAETITGMFEAGNWPGYTIEVHALKSASRQIGAVELSDLAALLEKAGNARDIDTIRRRTGEMLDKYRSYHSILAPYCEEKKAEPAELPEATPDILRALFAGMREALENLDMDGMEAVCNEIARYSFSGKQAAYAEQLAEATADIDVDRCSEILEKWEAVL